MLSRKHFKKVAEIIKKIPAKLEINCEDIPIAEKTRRLIANDLADWFQLENPKFDRKRFLKACDLINIEDLKELCD